MASTIRRTLSPASHHNQPSPFHNGSTTTTTTIPTHLSLNSPSPPPHKTKRTQHLKLWRKPFYRCLLFFFIGFLLGILPFGHIEQDVTTHDFSFEIIKPDIVRVQEEDDQVVRRAADSVVPKRDDVEVKFDVMLAQNENENENAKFDYQARKLLIVVTPTYNRSLQGYYLNRLGQLLRLVNPPILWIVVEMNAQSPETAQILRNTGVMYRHLVCKKNSTEVKDRGVQQRNTALEHIEVHKLDGIVYFADDDNVYSIQLFERIREISRFGTWPVAMLAQSKNKAILEGPVCNGSQVIGWHTNEKSKRLRRFHVDMSGFAFNSTILWDPKRWRRPFLNPIRQLDTVKEGFQETTFIEQLVAEESQMEGIPNGCGNIMNWHLHLDACGVLYPKGWSLQRNLEADLSIG